MVLELRAVRQRGGVQSARSVTRALPRALPADVCYACPGRAQAQPNPVTRASNTALYSPRSCPARCVPAGCLSPGGAMSARSQLGRASVWRLALAQQPHVRRRWRAQAGGVDMQLAAACDPWPCEVWGEPQLARAHVRLAELTSRALVRPPAARPCPPPTRPACSLLRLSATHTATMKWLGLGAAGLAALSFHAARAECVSAGREGAPLVGWTGLAPDDGAPRGSRGRLPPGAGALGATSVRSPGQRRGVASVACGRP